MRGLFRRGGPCDDDESYSGTNFGRRSNRCSRNISSRRRGGRKPIDDRTLFTSIVFLLKIGIGWRDLPIELAPAVAPLGGGSKR